MTRILAYNILVGGKGRINKIERMIRLADPDVVGLVEAMDEGVVKELAWRLGMQYRMNALAGGCWEPEIALLSRLPIVSSKVHVSPVLRTGAFLEVCVREEHGGHLTVFVAHLVAEFFRGRGGDGPRCEEVREILRIMRAHPGPHVLLGDFNALAPGDRLKASILLRYLVELDRYHKIHPEARKGLPSLAYVIPPKLRFLNPLLRLVSRSRLLGLLLDELGSLYAPRGSVDLLCSAGYVDCFRHVNPRAWGFTCPAIAPAGRIDYLFADPTLATRLSICKVFDGDGHLKAWEASDHLPVMVDFGREIETTSHFCEHSSAYLAVLKTQLF
jgi:endonuclease/exonuclease/phosphatase family metal-dependent hydrolase